MNGNMNMTEEQFLRCFLTAVISGGMLANGYKVVGENPKSVDTLVVMSRAVANRIMDLSVEERQ